jgi:hypothetical protein
LRKESSCSGDEKATKIERAIERATLMSYAKLLMARKSVDDGWMRDGESGERKSLRQQDRDGDLPFGVTNRVRFTSGCWVW